MRAINIVNLIKLLAIPQDPMPLDSYATTFDDSYAIWY